MYTIYTLCLLVIVVSALTLTLTQSSWSWLSSLVSSSSLYSFAMLANQVGIFEHFICIFHKFVCDFDYEWCVVVCSGWLHKQRLEHITEHSTKVRNSRIHGSNSEHLCKWMCSFTYSSPLWLVCFCKNGQSQKLQATLFWWLFSQSWAAFEVWSNHRLYLLQHFHVPSLFQIRQFLLERKQTHLFNWDKLLMGIEFGFFNLKTAFVFGYLLFRSQKLWECLMCICGYIEEKRCFDFGSFCINRIGWLKAGQVLRSCQEL